MNKTKLATIIIFISLITATIGGIFIGYEIGYKFAKNDPQIGKFADFDCYDGCLYAEWITYGYKTLNSSSELYDQCINVCLQGEVYFQ